MNRGLMPSKYAARKYKIPLAWLEAEARKGRLSCLVAESQVLFDEKILVRELANKVGKPRTEQAHYGREPKTPCGPTILGGSRD